MTSTKPHDTDDQTATDGATIGDVLSALAAAPLSVRMQVAIDTALVLLDRRSEARRAAGTSDQVTFADVVGYTFAFSDDPEVRLITGRCLESLARGEQPN